MSNEERKVTYISDIIYREVDMDTMRYLEMNRQPMYVRSAANPKDMIEKYITPDKHWYYYPDYSAEPKIDNNTGRMEYPTKEVCIAFHPEIEEVLSINFEAFNNAQADFNIRIKKCVDKLDRISNMSFVERVKFIIGRECL